ncbi:MAG: GMC family oxidoreductase [Gemmatimonadota bacterium]
MLTGHDVDLCVIGSGPAGALVANACAARGIRTLLVESGPRLDRAHRAELQRRFVLLEEDPWPRDAERDAFTNASDFGYDLNVRRVRAVGGTTLSWMGMAPRLRESDFRTGTLYGLGADWPIQYADLEPYYVRAEHEMGVSGERGPDDPWRSAPYPMEPFPDSYGDSLWRRAAAALGVNVSLMPAAKNNARAYDGRPPCTTFSTCPICPGGAQYSADWHAFKAERTGHCTILPDTTARRIELDAAGRVRVVHASSRDGAPHEIRARAVVVAANAVESARLLLLSRVGHEAMVGRFLMEHWKITTNGLSSERDFPDRIGFPTLTAYHRYEGSDRGERGAVRLLFPNPGDPLESMGRQPGRWGRSMAKHECEAFGHMRRIEASAEHLPHPESRVTLDPAVTDCFGDPAPRLCFVLDDNDRRTLDVAREAMRTMAEAAQLTDVHVGTGFGGGSHLMGTCRMSLREEDGVADPNARVHGTRNLYLAGSSLFPTGGSVNPTLTIAALSLRLADHLLKSLVPSSQR